VIRHIGPSPAVGAPTPLRSTNHGTPDTGDLSPIHVAFVRQPSSAARASWVFPHRRASRATGRMQVQIQREMRD